MSHNVDNSIMVTGFPHSSLLARICVTCFTLVGLAIMGQEHAPHVATSAFGTGGSQSPHSVAADALAADLPVADLLPNGNSFGKPPQEPARLALPVSTPTAAPQVPSPTPTPETPLGPQWGRVHTATPLRNGPSPGDPEAHILPKESYLKILASEAGRYRVYYSGNGDDLDPGEGWVDPAHVDLTQAPRWVTARQPVLLWSGPSSREQTGALPAGAVVEVLSDLGRRLQVFYLGDGYSRPQAEGWVDVAALGPAGPLIVAEKWGMRMLSRVDVKSIEEGNGVWLRVPYRTQLDGSEAEDANCGPASVSMALQFFRLLVPTAELRTMAERLQGTSDPDLGFSIQFLKGAVDRLGMKGLDLETRPERLKTWTIGDVRRHLSEGHPVIPELRFRAMPGRALAGYGEDHYVVLTGMLGDDFIYNDSVDVDAPGYGRLISEDELRRAWGSSFFPFAAFAVSAP